MNNDTKKKKSFEIKDDEEKIKDAIELMKIYYNIVHENSKQIFRIRGFYIVAFAGLFYLRLSKLTEIKEIDSLIVYIIAIVLTIAAIGIEGIITSWQTNHLIRIKQLDVAIQDRIKVNDSQYLSEIFHVPKERPEGFIQIIKSLIASPSLTFLYSACLFIIGFTMLIDFLSWKILMSRTTYIKYIIFFIFMILSIILPFILICYSKKLNEKLKTY